MSADTDRGRLIDSALDEQALESDDERRTTWRVQMIRFAFVIESLEDFELP